MMFQQRFHGPIERAEITCSVRIWQRPHVKVGGRYRVGAGEIEVSGIREISLDDITPALARASGFASVVELLKTAKHGAGERVFVVSFHYLGPCTPDDVAGRGELSAVEVAELLTRLDNMDRRAAAGPWTRETLRLIADNPGTRAADLAALLGRSRDDFKRDVRKLKRLGLTSSLETGYEISPRGRSLLTTAAP
jgi:hypothetical protein